MFPEYVIQRCRKKTAKQYWTGRGWSVHKMMAKSYSFNGGHDVIRKRFHRQKPVPIVTQRNVNNEGQASMDSRHPQAKHSNQGTLHPLRNVAAPVDENGLVLPGQRPEGF